MARMSDLSNNGTVKTNVTTKNGVTNYNNKAYGYNTNVVNTTPTTQTSAPSFAGNNYNENDLRNIYNGSYSGGADDNQQVESQPQQAQADYSSYYNELQKYLDEMTARNEELAKAQEAQRQKQISDNTEESRRRLQSAYNTQRRDIIRSSGNMSGAKVAGLTNAGNTYNNNITELNNNADQQRTSSNIEYLGALADIANNKYKNKYNLLLNSPYYAK